MNEQDPYVPREPLSFDTEVPVHPITQNSLTLVKHGAREGATIATKAAFLYAFFLGFISLLWNDASFHISSALFLSFVSMILGLVPAITIGALGGAIIGALFRQLQHSVAPVTALALGMGGGGILFMLLTPLVIWLLYDTFDGFMRVASREPFVILWGIPCAVALLCFAWVGHRLNLLLSTVDSTLDAPVN